MRVKYLIPFLVLVLIFGFGLSCNGTSGESKEQTESSKKIEALVCSESFVKDYLVSPSSAKFPYINDKDVKVEIIEENKYFVASYVDSENAFGAMIRTYYTCAVTLLEDDKYRVENLEFEE